MASYALAPRDLPCVKRSTMSLEKGSWIRAEALENGSVRTRFTWSTSWGRELSEQSEEES